jgi:hypothetical protein
MTWHGADYGAADPAIRRAEHDDKRRNAPIILAMHGIGFISKNDGAHLICEFDDDTVDFWPGTGRWQVRGNGQTRCKHGIWRMIDRMTNV